MSKKCSCYANCHMTPEEFGLWNYCRSVCFGSKVVYLSGRGISKAFSGVSKNVIYRIAKRLIAKGWLRLLAPYSRNPKTGTLIPVTAYALDHDEWVAKYSATDCRPVPESGQDKSAPVPVVGRTCPDSNASCPGIGTDLSRNQEQYLKDSEVNSESESESGGAKTKGTHTHSSENKVIAGKIQAQVCTEFETTANPRLLTAILTELDAGRSGKEVYEALKTTKIEYNDAMRWKTLADNLPNALIQQDMAREREARTKRLLEEETARLQAEGAREREEAARKQAEIEAMIEPELVAEFPHPLASTEIA